MHAGGSGVKTHALILHVLETIVGEFELRTGGIICQFGALSYILHPA